jgi:hypothetical protein
MTYRNSSVVSIEESLARLVQGRRGGAVDLKRRRFLKQLALLPVVASSLVGAISGCGGSGGSTGDPGSGPAPAKASRTWQMGFFFTPPRNSPAEVLHTIDLFSTRSELGVIHTELPWTDLLNGMSPEAILDRDRTNLVAYLRGRGQRIYFMADLTDGLARDQEAPQLRQLGRSITEPEVQQVYRDFVLAVAQILQPDYLGLAAETNLIRAAAGAPIYYAVVQAANDAAADLNTAGYSMPLLISVQVETAWGALDGSGAYTGIETDFGDFPFMQLLGLSSYPYLGWAQPEDIPDNYYGRILNGRSLPVMVAEGGWTSASVGARNSSPEMQARYITHQADLLDSVAAEAVIQTLFADIDLTSLADPVPDILPLFASIGLMDPNFVAKPALAGWDVLFGRIRQ